MNLASEHGVGFRVCIWRYGAASAYQHLLEVHANGDSSGCPTGCLSSMGVLSLIVYIKSS